MTTTRRQERLQKRKNSEQHYVIRKKRKLQKLETNSNYKPILEPIFESNEVLTVEVGTLPANAPCVKGTNTDKQLKDYKIFVFDLDNTLYLHKVDQIYAEKYHKKVNNFLNYLKDNNKLLYIATHNFSPVDYFNRMIIQPLLFNGIIKETKDVHPSLNNISEYTSKKDMILEILDKHKDLTKDDVIFFDDHMFNIKEVEKLNVKSIYVNESKGIDFSEIF
jgi:HAD superfamily phosphatase (TIGR01681 family)